MEINPYAATQIGNLEIRGDEELREGVAPGTEQSQAETGQDRVDIIAAQNLAAKDVDFFDLETAMRVLGQVENGLPQISSQDLDNFFHYDNLRQSLSL